MMSFSLLLFLAAGLSAAGAAPPDALSLLSAAARGPAAAYEGELSVEGGAKAARSIRIQYAPPDRYRREISGIVVISNGRKEWIHDRARGKVWEGEAQAGPEDELGLLASNYDLRTSTGEDVAGRSAWRIDIQSRTETRLSRSVWIDRRYKLVLRSESYRPDGSLLSRVRFTRLAIAARGKTDEKLFEFNAPPGVKPVKRSESDPLALAQVKEASGLEAKTPSWLPSGYVFESVDALPYHGKKIIHYRYSDGVNVLSLFQCPPRSRVNFGGKPREKVKVGAAKGFLSWSDEGNVLGWTAKDAKMVLVGPLSLDALKKIAESVK